MKHLASAFALLLALAASAARAQNCNGTSTGLVPLVELGSGLHQGYPGGLFPGGGVLRPDAHDADGLRIARTVTPLDAAGNPAAEGRIVLLSIGMSNCTQEFSTWIPIANSDPHKNPRVQLVDGAQGGQTAAIIANPNANFWTVVQQRLTTAGATVNQVQAVWLKEANAQPTQPFPSHVQIMLPQLVQVCQNLKTKYPNCRVVFVSGRTYGGYATTTLNPEPYAYETSFAFQWLVRDQIGGDPALNFDPGRGPVVAPYVTWGPYLWADGLTPRCDGLIWRCQDFASDGTHPAPGAGLGRDKVAQMLNRFFRTNGLARPWYLAAGSGSTCTGAAAAAECYGRGLVGNRGIAPMLAASTMPALPSDGPFAVQLTGGAPSAPGVFVGGSARYDVGQAPLLGGWLLVQPTLAWPTATDASGRASLAFGPLPAIPGACGTVLYFQAGVVDAFAPQGVSLTPGLAVRLGS
jgi:hypothetical protein